MDGLPTLAPASWVLVYLAAYMIGLSKTGLPGIGIIAIALFSLVLPPLAAVGSVLLLLIGADCIAIATYRRDAEWKYLWKLFPWTAVGIVLGTVVMKWLAGSPRAMQQLIGGILLVLAAFQLWQRFRPQTTPVENEPALPAFASPVTGILAGFTTMAANASGPIMVLYFLAMRLPKIAFVGTTAWFFFVVNLFKVPFGIYLGTVSFSGLLFALLLFPGAVLGGLTGRWLLVRIHQVWFDRIAIAFTLLAGLRLCFF
jgi:hypothetical protein